MADRCYSIEVKLSILLLNSTFDLSHVAGFPEPTAFGAWIISEAGKSGRASKLYNNRFISEELSLAILITTSYLRRFGVAVSKQCLAGHVQVSNSGQGRPTWDLLSILVRWKRELLRGLRDTPVRSM